MTVDSAYQNLSEAAFCSLKIIDNVLSSLSRETGRTVNPDPQPAA
ncbi:MAG: hypothetical protein ACI4TM_11740 [Candidatus Cryptobacteroides sp.]